MLSSMSTKYMEIPGFKHGNKWKLVRHVGQFKGSCAWVDLDLMFALTQIQATSKACWQTGVNLFVTFFFTMAEGGRTQDSLKREIEDILKQIFEIDIKTQSFQSQGPNKSHTSIKGAKTWASKEDCTAWNLVTVYQGSKEEGTAIGGYHGGPRAKPSQGYVLGKLFNELLNWSTDCTYIQYSGLARQGATSR